MSTLNMIRDICDETEDCKACPFVNDNMLTPGEKEGFDDTVINDCFFHFVNPDSWDTERIDSTARAAYQAKFKKE